MYGLRPRSILPAAVVLAAIAAPLQCQLRPLGPDFQVNSYTTGWQQGPRISVAPDGDFTIVWCCGEKEPPATGSALVARRFDAGGTPIGGEIALSEDRSSWEFDVAADPAGNFTVTWGAGSEGCPGCWVDFVRARRFTPKGLPRGVEFAVSDPPGTMYTGSSSVSVGADGGFVVAWNEYGAWARRYDPDGEPLGAAFEVGGASGYAHVPVLASRPDGGFLVVWEEIDGTSYAELLGRIYDADGFPVGSPIPVAPRDLAPSDPALAASAEGDSVVTHTCYLPGDRLAVQARRFDAEGAPLGAPIAVDSYPAGLPFGSQVEREADGGFVVAWTSHGSPGSDDSGWSIQGRRFAADGTPLGPQMQVNSFTTGYQSQPAVGVQANGDIVVAWSSDESPGDDYGSVLARRFRPPFFYDGFESGDTSRWSAPEPPVPVLGR